jgi:phage baseplate assembly protein V
VITRTNDTTATQTIQVELHFDEVADAIEHLQPFGVSFRPTPDSEVIVLAAAASQDNLVALAATNRSVRPTGIEEGEGGLYTPSGWKVFCDENDRVFITRKDASQSFMRGEDTKDALSTYADAVTQAVGEITGEVVTTKAVATLTQAKTQLDTAIQSALSTKFKGE